MKAFFEKDGKFLLIKKAGIIAWWLSNDLYIRNGKKIIKVAGKNLVGGSVGGWFGDSKSNAWSNEKHKARMKKRFEADKHFIKIYTLIKRLKYLVNLNLDSSTFTFISCNMVFQFKRFNLIEW
jgi:hypothetical protein